VFPQTRHSAIVRLRAADEGERRLAWDALVSAYWKPVYKYLRARWAMSPEHAEDVTQEFFARAFEHGFLADYDPEKARFRTWLRTCLDRLAANDAKAARRLKRGGGAVMTPLDFVSAEGEVRELEIRADTDLDAWFQQEFVRALFARAVEAVERECRESGRIDHFALFAECDLADVDATERPSYKSLAEARGWAIHDVTNRLATVRRAFRAHVLRLLRDACASDEEFRTEARAVLGQNP
jgi:RNA polymerase sigma factor (sigma-70 family)